jgi:DNA-binding Xre family transcriptional regulator
MAAVKPPLTRVYARNIEHIAVMRGIPTSSLATELGLTANTMNRIRFARSRYLDPEVLVALLDLFECEPNDLLLPQPGIDYSHDIRTR